MLGMLYLTGLRVPRDQAQAMMWFSRSVAQCNQYVQFSIEHQNTPPGTRDADSHPPAIPHEPVL